MAIRFRIGSYNVNGLRARLKHGHLQAFLDQFPQLDILCLQETKAEEAQVKLPASIQQRFPHRYWRSTHGTTQRKGLSGTAIWSSVPALCELEPFDEEGRVTAVEFESFKLASVYTPTTGSHKNRFLYRTVDWHMKFHELLDTHGGPSWGCSKPTIVCGDLNVCHKNRDVYDPGKLANQIAGFLDIERAQFDSYLALGYTDAFRELYPTQEGAFTWWNPRYKPMFQSNLGLRLDYFLLSDGGGPFVLHECAHWPEVRGSDHCPITLDVTIGEDEGADSV